MQATHLRKWFVLLLLGGGFVVWDARVARADSTEPINGPYAPESLPGAPVSWSGTPSAAGQIGQAGGVTWTFSSIPLASSNDVAIWWGTVSNEVKLSFLNNAYSRQGEILTPAPAESDWASGRMVWRGQSELGTAFAQTRFTMTLSNMTATSPGFALSFDGTNDYVQSQGNISLSNRSFTIEAWAKRDGVGRDEFFLGQGVTWVINKGLHFGFRSNNKFTFAFWANDLDTTNTYTDTGWHHWAGTYDTNGRVRRIFLDGVQVASDTASANFTGSGFLHVGSDPVGSSPFDGQIDEVRIWDVARTAAQIQQYRFSRPATNETGLVAFYRFDEGAGATAADATGHGYIGGLSNGPVWVSSTLPRPFEMIPAISLGLSTNVGAVLRITNGMRFTANLRFDATTNGAGGPWYPAYDVYNVWHSNTYQPPAGNANSSVRAGFYYSHHPTITTNPVSPIGTNAGSTVTFTVTATGLAPITYQWFRDGTLLSAATNRLVLSDVQYNGEYWVVASHNAASVTSQVATLTVTNTLGGQIKAPPEANSSVAPYCEPEDAASWAGGHLYARNWDGLLTVKWTGTNGSTITNSVYLRSVPATHYTVGDVIPKPAGWTLLQPPTSEPRDAVYWHATNRILYAAAPMSATITWYKSDGIQTNVVVDCRWPADPSRYQIYIAGSPAVRLTNVWPNAQAKLLGSDGQVGADEAEVANEIFRAPAPTKPGMSGTGKCLLVLAPGDPDATTNIYFQFIQCVAWTNLDYLDTNATAIIGEPIGNDYGYQTDSKNTRPFLPNRLSPYCPNFFSPEMTNNSFWLIPVNRGRTDTNIDDLVLVFYQEGTNLFDVARGTMTNSHVAWPYKPVRYDCQWPTNAPTLVIASEKGSGPIQLDNWEIYFQNDTNQPGFNPNDEHAVKVTENGVVPRLHVNPQRLMVQEGGSARMEVSLTAQPPTNVIVSVTAQLTGYSNTITCVSPGATNLLFTTTNWQTPQLVVFNAEADGDGLDGMNAFTVQASGGVEGAQYVLVHEVDTNKLGLFIDALAFSVPEETSRPLSLRLTQPPTNDVTVDIIFVQDRGDTDTNSVTIAGTNRLTFTLDNWATNQTLTLQAAEDADVADGQRTIRIEAWGGGLAVTNELVVTALDADLGPNAVYALRDDLGDSLGAPVSVTSEPYVLLIATNSAGVPVTKVFRVVAEDSNYRFQYDGKAGQPITPPFPLTEGVDWVSSYGTNGPYWRDRKNIFWAAAAGDDGGATNIVMKFFYPFMTEAGFYFKDGPSKADGAPVAWLDHRPGGRTNIPTDVTYTITWPDDTKALHAGETLVESKNYLPDIAGQTSVQVLYQQAEARQLGSSVDVIDPTRIHEVELENLPAGIRTARSLTGETYFPDLPPHLRSRFWYEQIPGKLKFKGEYKHASGDGEPRGYLLLNVISARDKAYLISLSTNADFLVAVNALAGAGKAGQALSVKPNDVFDSLALTAGRAQAGGYVTLAFNNAVRETDLPADRPTVIELAIIRVTCPLYQGGVRVILSDDPFGEQVALRHTGDFAGQADQYQFEWKYFPGTEEPGETSTWQPVSLTPSGWGALDTVVPGKNDGNNLRTLVDGWYRCHYRTTNTFSDFTTNNCAPGWSEWTKPALVEGWTKRVLAKINPYDQKFADLTKHTVDLVVSIVGQSGARWIGDVPFNQDALTDKGLIEVYESILNRGIRLSIEATPPVQSSEDASRALMTVARRLADLYMVLGNEAYADASDPTIGFPTTGGPFSQYASSIHCFLGQTPSLIEEELALLRGLADQGQFPAYNRLKWNFINDTAGGQAAYVLNYDIKAGKAPPLDKLDEDDAKATWPQGHGDAWGHYLMALKNFYRLLRNTNFVWTSGPESVDIGGEATSVGYADERKFAQAAAARARTGAEIGSLTYRNAYDENPSGQWQGYVDANTNQAWGVSEWACRAGQGAFFDWVTINALLPPHGAGTGATNVDRTSVTELREIAAAYQNIEEELDKADIGLNPLGLAKNVLPLDISAKGIVNDQSHFDQVYDRAKQALNNAIAVFNAAVGCTQQLRKQSDDQTAFGNNVLDREVDFTNRLIEIYGYPYAEDIGPGGYYASGYKGPDLVHYFYTDASRITGEAAKPALQVTGTLKETVVNRDGSLTQVAKPVTYHLAADGLGVVKPAAWTKRDAPGEIQNAHSDLLQARARFERSLKEYDDLLAEIDAQARLLRAAYQLNATEIWILRTDKNYQESLNDAITRSRSRQLQWACAARMATTFANAIAEALPKSVGFSVDATSVGRSLIMVGGALASELATAKSSEESLVELDHQQAKEMAQAQQNIQLTTIRQEQAILTQIAQLQQLVRKEVLLRLEIYTQQEALQQMSGRCLAALKRGERLQQDQLRFRQQTAAEVTQARYKDMAFRIFRNENLQKYRAQYDLAATYVYLAAKAYDYESNLAPGDDARPGSEFFNMIVRSRTIGSIVDGIPQFLKAGDGGLANAMAQMKGNFDNLKTQIGLTDPQETSLAFSLRTELLRGLPTTSEASKSWREALKKCRVADLNQHQEFKQHCQFENPRPEPGLVIEFRTFVNKDVNFFGWPYGPADSKFNETATSIKIYSAGVSFSNYRLTGAGGMGATPVVYLVPVGSDVLRCPRLSDQDDKRITREWKVLDQWLPVPFKLGDTNGNFTSAGQARFASDDYVPAFASEASVDQRFFGNLRAFPSFNAWHSSIPGNPPETTKDYNTTLLISRSVWNTKWLLVIPASGIGSDYEESLNRFIEGGVTANGRDNNGVSDIKLRITAFSYRGR